MKEDPTGKKLKCKRCGNEATIVKREGRYFVFCPTEQSEDYLKTYNQNRKEVLK